MYNDSLGHEIHLGDILQYPTRSGSNLYLQYGVVIDAKKVKLNKFELGYPQIVDPKYGFKTGDYSKPKDVMYEKKVTIQAPERAIIITDLELPDTPEFDAMRQLSDRLLKENK